MGVLMAYSSWRTTTIQDVAEKVAMGPFGSSIKVETFVEEGVPIISGQHLHGTRVDDEPGFDFITHEHAQKLGNANVVRGDIVLTHRGTIGQVAFIPVNSRFDRYVVSQSQFYLRCDRSQVLPEFLVAYFHSPEGQHQLLANTSQVGVPSIAQPVTYLRTLEVPIPPLPEQRAISHILGTLDDKIKLNQRMNQTLEEMVRAIFQDWFVDFGPVRAKLESREHYLPPDLWSHFPDRLVDSELGQIPEGWQVKPLEQIIRLNPMESMKRGTLAPYLDMAALPTTGSAPLRPMLREFTSGTRFRNGDTLLARITPCLENGKTAFVQTLPEGTAGWGSTEFIVMRSIFPVPPEFAYLLARDLTFRSYAIQGMTGTSGRQRVQAEALRAYLLPCPPLGDLEVFGSVVKQVFQKVKSNMDAIDTLSDQRDALLPRLVDGELSKAALS